MGSGLFMGMGFPFGMMKCSRIDGGAAYLSLNVVKVVHLK